MLETATDLPGNIAALQAMVLDSRSRLSAIDAELTNLRLALRHREFTIEKLKLQLARLRRMQFGRSSEKLSQEIEQLELLIEEFETPEPAAVVARAADEASAVQRPARRALPDHLPREAVVHSVGCTCPTCGGNLRPIGEDVSEVLEYVPEHWKVIRHVRPKLACDGCNTIVRPAASSVPVAGRADPARGGNKAYDADPLLDFIQKQGAQAVIPSKANRLIQRPYDRHHYIKPQPTSSNASSAASNSSAESLPATKNSPLASPPSSNSPPASSGWPNVNRP